MANQSPLERSARALWITRADEFNDWDSLDGDERDALKLEARAVLVAIREPSEGMLGSFGIHKARMKQNWQAMIDSALEDNK